MKHIRSSCAVLAITAGLVQPAFAELRAQDVFDLWSQMYVNPGMVITTESTRTEPGRVDVSGVKLEATDPKSGFSYSLGFGDMSFVEQEDGSVEVIPGSIFTLEFLPPEDRGTQIRIDATLAVNGVTYNVAEHGDGYRIRSAADGMELTDLAITANGQPLPVTADVTFDLGAMNAVTDLTLPDDGAMGYASTGSIDSINIDGTFGVEGQGIVTFRYNSGGMTSTSNFFLPAEIRAAMQDPEAAASMQKIQNPFASGLRMEFDVQTQGSEIYLDTSGTPNDLTFEGSSDGGNFAFVLNPKELSLRIAAQNGRYRVASPQIPFPDVAIGIAELNLAMGFPLEMTDVPGRYNANLTLRDLDVPEQIWGMFDPMGAVPHDPATVVLDLGGAVTWLVDITDPNAMAEMSGTQPLTIDTVEINDLTLAIAGAELLGTGNFHLDWQNTDFQGNPGTTGTADLSLRGGMQLMDALGQIGLMPTDAVAGMKAMIAAFAKPGDSADHFTSKIEFGADGSITANGQRLK